MSSMSALGVVDCTISELGVIALPDYMFGQRSVQQPPARLVEGF